MGKVLSDLQKLWVKTGGKPVVANSDWCKDWKEKHPGNCEGCPQEQNCGDFACMIVDIVKGTGDC